MVFVVEQTAALHRRCETSCRLEGRQALQEFPIATILGGGRQVDLGFHELGTLLGVGAEQAPIDGATQFLRGMDAARYVRGEIAVHGDGHVEHAVGAGENAFEKGHGSCLPIQSQENGTLRTEVLDPAQAGALQVVQSRGYLTRRKQATDKRQTNMTRESI